MDSAWDRLLDLFDHLAADPTTPVPDDLEPAFLALATDAMADGMVDSELHLPDVSRWLVGLVTAQRVVRLAHPELDPDDDVAHLRVIVTRWLHPARPR